MILKRVGPLSAAKIAGVLYVLVGLVMGTIFALFATLGFAAAPDDAPAGFGLLFGVGALVWAPVFYGLLGFFGALIFAGLYNLMAGMLGGVELDLQ
jgi:hypothetical protein